MYVDAGDLYLAVVADEGADAYRELVLELVVLNLRIESRGVDAQGGVEQGGFQAQLVAGGVLVIEFS